MNPAVKSVTAARGVCRPELSERPLIESSECRLIMMDQDKKAATTLWRLRLHNFRRCDTLYSNYCWVSLFWERPRDLGTLKIYKSYLCRQAVGSVRCNVWGCNFTQSAALCLQREERKEKLDIYIYKSLKGTRRRRRSQQHHNNWAARLFKCLYRFVLQLSRNRPHCSWLSGRWFSFTHAQGKHTLSP